MIYIYTQSGDRLSAIYNRRANDEKKYTPLYRQKKIHTLCARSIFINAMHETNIPQTRHIMQEAIVSHIVHKKILKGANTQAGARESTNTQQNPTRLKSHAALILQYPPKNLSHLAHKFHAT